MALQNNNLMLLDADGLPRTIDTANDTLGIGVSTSFADDLTVGGDLTVSGDIISSGTMDVVVTDNFIDLNNGNTVVKAGGLTVNVQAAVSQSMAAGATFESIATAAGAFATLTITGFNPGDPGGANIQQGDIIEISGLSDLGENNGLFVVQSAANAVGGAIEIKNSQSASVPFAQTNFEDGSESAGLLGGDLSLGIMAISNGSLPADGVGGTIAQGSFATAYATAATDDTTGGAGALIYGDAAAVSLQEAYDEGQAIQISNLGDMVITTDEVTPQNFVLSQGGTAFNYLATDAANDTLVLGAKSGAGVGTAETNVNLFGHVSSDIVFADTGADTTTKLISARATDKIEVSSGGVSLDATQGALNYQLKGFSSTLGMASFSQAAGGYNQPGAGSIDFTVFDQDGVSSTFTHTITVPGQTAADAAAFAAAENATLNPNGLEFIDAGGFVAVQTLAGGSRVSFSIDSDTGGVAGNLGFGALPIFAASGSGAIYLEAPSNDIQMLAGGNIDLMALNRGIKLQTQTAAKKIEIAANSGTLDMDATTIDALAQDSFTLSAVNSSGTINASSLDLDSTAGGIDLDASGGEITLDSGSAVRIGATIQSTVAIDGTAINIGQAAASPIDMDGTSVAIGGTQSSEFVVSGLDQTLSITAAGGGASQKIILDSLGTGAAAIEIGAAAGGVDMDGQGVNIASNGAANALLLSSAGAAANAIAIQASAGGIDLDGAGVNLASTGGANTMAIASAGDVSISSGASGSPISLAGYIKQDVTSSDGVGIEVTYDAAAGGNSVTGDMWAFYENGGNFEAKNVAAGDAEAVGVAGVFLEGVAPGAAAKTHTGHGFAVTLAFDGGGNPGNADVGQPVYLSATSGKAAKAAPTGTGVHIVRLGFALNTSGGVLWAPQYIAKRP